MTDIFGSYNFGYTDYDFMMPKTCSIEDITDEDEFEDELEEDINADDLSKAFDNVIEDWKIKMEVIIGDGLKKLRKAHKERKLMMKYLPGDRKVQAAKQSIAKDWKIDFQKGFGTTHKKLEKLAADKAKEVEGVVKTDFKEPQVNKYKKKVININLKATPESAYGNLKNLISQLDKMVQHVHQTESPTLHSIPIYSKEARGQILPAYSNYWLELQKSMISKQESKQSFMEVLQDFKVKYNNKKVEDSVKATKRILEINQSPSHSLKQFKKNGQEHYLLVKTKNSSPSQMEAEDIFKDWRSNLTDVFEQRRLAALEARKNRKRKLSNRALRKELLKEIDEAEKQKPMSYSDALKRNLKAPMEDIFEAWRDYLQELDEILSNDSRTSFSTGETAEEILNSAQCYQKSLISCGQPTVKSAKKSTFDKEVIFAAWRHNLAIEEKVEIPEKKKYEPESFFANWKYNLKEEYGQDGYKAELILEDWLHNFEENNPICRSESKLLKNKQRNQRKSKKNNKN